ncbi:hypothetical protein [Methylobacterium sp. Leaf89]|uniref:hypothetical protein n=1 Tax=Methylobacterium sp. Leaf89 TaxID=1736245 RepID=UPI0006F45B6E|nr:hypothetical protein [Methylobacterium sp. Leaf89]KQO73440.1 hypothetical protein ASF18_16745 [Methylobacterium sp. Leaf89]
MMRAILPLSLVLAVSPAWANPPVDETETGGCLELKLDGRPASCNHDFRLVDDGKGEVNFVTGYREGQAKPEMVVNFATAQVLNMENAYGYALGLTHVTLMTVGAPDQQRHWPAKGLCFLVKPSPVRAGAKAVQQDVVVMCSATMSDASAPVHRIDWKFVF